MLSLIRFSPCLIWAHIYCSAIALAYSWSPTNPGQMLYTTSSHNWTLPLLQNLFWPDCQMLIGPGSMSMVYEKKRTGNHEPLQSVMQNGCSILSMQWKLYNGCSMLMEIWLGNPHQLQIFKKSNSWISWKDNKRFQHLLDYAPLISHVIKAKYLFSVFTGQWNCERNHSQFLRNNSLCHSTASTSAKDWSARWNVECTCRLSSQLCMLTFNWSIHH